VSEHDGARRIVALAPSQSPAHGPARGETVVALPIGVMVFPGTGIQDNLADKARKLGIPVWRPGTGGT
jgi:hypothetical protein